MVIGHVGDEHIPQRCARLQKTSQDGVASVARIIPSPTFYSVEHDTFNRRVGTNSQDGLDQGRCTRGCDEDKARRNAGRSYGETAGGAELRIERNGVDQGAYEWDGGVGKVTLGERRDVRHDDDCGRLGGGDGTGEL